MSEAFRVLYVQMNVVIALTEENILQSAGRFYTHLQWITAGKKEKTEKEEEINF